MAKDFLWRDLTSGGSADFVGRAVTAGEDFAGRDTWGAAQSATTAYALGDRIILTTGEVLEATTAGTSGETAPAAPGFGETVTDGTVTWTQVANS